MPADGGTDHGFTPGDFYGVNGVVGRARGAALDDPQVAVVTAIDSARAAARGAGVVAGRVATDPITVRMRPSRW